MDVFPCDILITWIDKIKLTKLYEKNRTKYVYIYRFCYPMECDHITKHIPTYVCVEPATELCMLNKREGIEHSGHSEFRSGGRERGQRFRGRSEIRVCQSTIVYMREGARTAVPRAFMK